MLKDIMLKTVTKQEEAELNQIECKVQGKESSKDDKIYFGTENTNSGKKKEKTRTHTQITRRANWIDLRRSTFDDNIIDITLSTLNLSEEKNFKLKIK